MEVYWKLSSAILLLFVVHDFVEGIFVRQSWLDGINTNQKNYGVAVSDVNHDGNPDFIVAGYNGPNIVFTFDKITGTVTNIAQEGTPYESLRNVEGNAIGVTACDIDGDGLEEIYFLNTNGAYAGNSVYGDKLYKWRNETYVDLFSDQVNKNMPAKSFAGRSVACVDRKGNGKYSVAVATYSYRGQGKFALVEMDESHPQNDVTSGTIVLKNVATEAGIDKSTGGRGIAVGPILGKDGRSDIFFGNEGNSGYLNAGANFLFQNRGNGKFEDIATSTGIADAQENVRGIALGDFNQDGHIDIAYGNWDGPHRLYLQRRSGDTVRFVNSVSTSFSYQTPTHIRTVIAADFDNDGFLEIFQNNIYHRNHLQPNKLFKVRPDGTSVRIEELPIGDALEPEGYGTGAAVTDFDGDGKLELLISHGEGNAQSLTMFKVSTGNGNNWIRVQPKSQHGAPARGASVKITTSDGHTQTHVIDGGSGYLCEMEPFAHVGLGSSTPTKLTVQWPDGKVASQALTASDVNRVHTVNYPSSSSEQRPSPQRPVKEPDCPSENWKAEQYRNLPVLCEGDRVTRGPGWNWGNEDSGRPGVVVSPPRASYYWYMLGRGDPHWVTVRWSNGRRLAYRMGSRGVQDLCRCGDCGRTPECQCTC